MILRKNEFNNIIDDIIDHDDLLQEKMDVNAFKNTYFKEVIGRLRKPSGYYKFNKKDYQTAINLYFYYSQEKNIYNILLLANIEKRLFDDERNNKKSKEPD